MKVFLLVSSLFLSLLSCDINSLLGSKNSDNKTDGSDLLSQNENPLEGEDLQGDKIDEDEAENDPDNNEFTSGKKKDSDFFAEFQLPELEEALKENWLEKENIEIPLGLAKEIIDQLNSEKLKIEFTDDEEKAPHFTSLVDGIVFPENIGRKNFFIWSSPEQFDIFYLELKIPVNKEIEKYFTSEESDDTKNEEGYKTLQFLTRETKFTPGKKIWDKLTSSAQKDKEIKASVYGIKLNKNKIIQIQGLKKPIIFKFLKERLEGSIYFWKIYSNNSKPNPLPNPGPNLMEGSIMVMPASGNADPVPFFGTRSPLPKYNDFCAGCHSISPDGEKYAIYEHKPGNPGKHQDVHFGEIKDFPKPRPNDFYSYPGPSTPSSEKTNFATFNPLDTDWVVYARKGDLYFKKISDGIPITTEIAFTAANTTTLYESMPSWSVKGEIAFARCKKSLNPDGFDLEGPCKIFTIKPEIISGSPTGEGTGLKELKGANDDEMNYYPEYSPDGDWISFTYHPLKTNGGSTYADPKKDPNSEINVFVVPSAGGTKVCLTPPHWKKFINSWTTWGKRASWLINDKLTPDKLDISSNWIAFSSNRDIYEGSPHSPKKEDMNIFMVRFTVVGGVPVISPPFALPNANSPLSGEHLPRWAVK